VFHVDLAKVYHDVAYVASVSDACCKHLFKKCFISFETYVCKRF
jgi:hypothetical protein